jgi:hypothetical protein
MAVFSICLVVALALVDTSELAPGPNWSSYQGAELIRFRKKLSCTRIASSPVPAASVTTAPPRRRPLGSARCRRARDVLAGQRLGMTALHAQTFVPAAARAVRDPGPWSRVGAAAVGGDAQRPPGE